MNTAGIGHPHSLKMGRKPRIFNPAVPHMSALIGGTKLPDPPPAIDWTDPMPDDLGMLLNDQLGDCTCAAMYHAIQVWSFHTDSDGPGMETNPDSDVLNAYEVTCGYVEGDESTDQGGVEQHVLHCWFANGIKTSAAQQPTNKLSAWFEVDPRNPLDIMRVINDCGVCYIGFDVPENILPPNGDPPPVWQLNRNAQIIGGHAVAVTGYDQNAGTLSLISWAKKYKMSLDFFHYYTSEAYALVDSYWVNKTGKTPLNMDLGTLTHQMRTLKSQWQGVDKSAV